MINSFSEFFTYYEIRTYCVDKESYPECPEEVYISIPTD